VVEFIPIDIGATRALFLSHCLNQIDQNQSAKLLIKNNQPNKISKA